MLSLKGEDLSWTHSSKDGQVRDRALAHLERGDISFYLLFCKHTR